MKGTVGYLNEGRFWKWKHKRPMLLRFVQHDLLDPGHFINMVESGLYIRSPKSGEYKEFFFTIHHQTKDGNSYDFVDDSGLIARVVLGIKKNE